LAFKHTVIKNMNLFCRLLPLFLLLNVVSPVWPQNASPSSSGDVVSVKTYPSLNPIPPQGTFQVAVQIHIQEGWHINAKEGLPEGFIPADLKLGLSSPFEVAGPVEYPPGIQRALAGETHAFPVYEKEVRILVPLRVKGSPKEKFLNIPFQLTVQACNDRFCLRPSTVSFQASVKLASSGEISQPVNSEMFNPPAAENASGQDFSQNIIASYLSQHGLLLTFLPILEPDGPKAPWLSWAGPRLTSSAFPSPIPPWGSQPR
jgi:DsbC/DsbD-like thiol-disulfide interchange protein